MIIWTTRDSSNLIIESETSRTHQGLVISEPWCEEQRVMSDVYAPVRYCRVWNAEKGAAETLCLGQLFECNPRTGWAEVDAPAEILAEVARQDAEALVAREAAETAARAVRAREAAERLTNTPEKGKLMVVTRGRKVPVGTTGKVFWMRDGRVGLALDDTKDARGHFTNVAWVDAAYLKAA